MFVPLTAAVALDLVAGIVAQLLASDAIAPHTVGKADVRLFRGQGALWTMSASIGDDRTA